MSAELTGEYVALSRVSSLESVLRPPQCLDGRGGIDDASSVRRPARPCDYTWNPGLLSVAETAGVVQQTSAGSVEYLLDFEDFKWTTK
jgi:hypothetical protein